MRDATQPFQFVTASYVTCVENQQATTVAELLESLDQASDAAIFYHTVQCLGRYHFLVEGFANDFAQWALASVNLAVLAERLASLDVRDYISIAELRADLRRILSEFCEESPGRANRRDTIASHRPLSS